MCVHVWLSDRVTLGTSKSVKDEVLTMDVNLRTDGNFCFPRSTKNHNISDIKTCAVVSMNDAAVIDWSPLLNKSTLKFNGYTLSITDVVGNTLQTLTNDRTRIYRILIIISKPNRTTHK